MVFLLWRNGVLPERLSWEEIDFFRGRKRSSSPEISRVEMTFFLRTKCCSSCEISWEEMDFFPGRNGILPEKFPREELINPKKTGYLFLFVSNVCSIHYEPFASVNLFRLARYPNQQSRCYKFLGHHVHQ